MSSINVVETAVADIQLDDDGVPSQVNGYRITKQLGEGTSSKVYHCYDGYGNEYAMKIINKSFLKRKREYKRVDGKIILSNALQKVQREVAIMKKLSHPSLVKLQEIIDSPADDKMFLILELIHGGQVMKWDDTCFRYRSLSTTSGVLSMEQVRICMQNMVNGLEYLHTNHICHRDIKPENILCESSTIYKLADFGVAHMHSVQENESGTPEKETLRNTEGTYHFLAPEATTGEEYDPYEVDIWALGVTMYALLCGNLPFGLQACNLTQVMESIRTDSLAFASHEELDDGAIELMTRMMEKNPRLRITIKELKVHPWLAQAYQGDQERQVIHERVEVTTEEIDAAFTPVNNFIMMARLKVKMSSRLARARTTLRKGESAITGNESNCNMLEVMTEGLDIADTVVISKQSPRSGVVRENFMSNSLPALEIPPLVVPMNDTPAPMSQSPRHLNTLKEPVSGESQPKSPKRSPLTTALTDATIMIGVTAASGSECNGVKRASTPSKLARLELYSSSLSAPNSPTHRELIKRYSDMPTYSMPSRNDSFKDDTRPPELQHQLSVSLLAKIVAPESQALLAAAPIPERALRRRKTHDEATASIASIVSRINTHPEDTSKNRKHRRRSSQEGVVLPTQSVKPASNEKARPTSPNLSPQNRKVNAISECTLPSFTSS